MIHPPSSLLIFDGMNDAGLVFNCNTYPDTVETPDTGGEGVKIQGVTGISTEYTTNSFLADAPRTRYYVRDYTALNWSVFEPHPPAQRHQPATGPTGLPRSPRRGRDRAAADGADVTVAPT